MIITIDVGGTSLRIAFFENTATTTPWQVFKVETMNDYVVDMQQIIKTIQSNLNGKTVEAIAMGLPGVFDDKKTTLLSGAVNLSNWINQPIKNDLEKVFQCNLFFANDVEMAAYAEAVFGQGNKQDFVIMFWGTGVGGAVVRLVNTMPIIYPFEPGCHIVESNGRPCGCGQKGCLEQYTGGAAIEKYYGKHPTELTEQEWNEVTDRFAQGIVNVTVMHPVKKIIFGGGVAIKQPDKVDQIAKKVNEMQKAVPEAQIVTTTFGDDAGLIGGVGLIKLMQK